MKFRKFIPVIVFALAALAIAGCKKDDDETKEYLEGSITLEMPKYVTKGFTKKFKIDTLATITSPDGSGVGYCFRNSVTSKSDTVLLRNGSYAPGFPDGVYTYSVGSEVGNGTLTLVAFGSEKYYSTSGKAEYVVVDPAMDGTGSLTGFNRSAAETLFTDSRDGSQYYCIEYDGTSWMTQNLGWKGAGAPYFNSEVMADVLGQYYTWEDARTACPEGWRLPTDEEVKALAVSFGGEVLENGDVAGVAGSFMADLLFNGESLWPYWPGVKITNEASMYMIPTGYGITAGDKFDFSDMKSYSIIWTADELNGRGVYRYIYEDSNTLVRGLGSKDSFAAPVRCIK